MKLCLDKMILITVIVVVHGLNVFNHLENNVTIMS